MANLISRLVEPRYPATAIGLDKDVAAVVHVERMKNNASRLRRAATFNISESLLRPSFDQSNILDPGQLAAVLRDLASSAGLLRQKRWSLSLPEATARTMVLTVEGQPQSGSE